MEWIILLLCLILAVGLVVLFIKKPSVNRSGKRVRTVSMLAILAVAAVMIFKIFGEHGGMSLVKQAIEDPAYLKEALFENKEEVEEPGVLAITVSGKDYIIKGKTFTDTEALSEYLSGRADIKKAMITDDYAYSVAMHDLMDMLQEMGLEYYISAEE